MNKCLVAAFLAVFGTVAAQARELPVGAVESAANVVDPVSVSVGSASVQDSDSAFEATSLITASSPAEVTSQAAPAQTNGQAAPPQTNKKSMAATVLLWLVVPGGGNFYNGAIGKGFIELGGTVGGIALIATATRDECVTVGRITSCGEEISTAQALSGLGVAAGFRIWGLISAINRTQDINSGKISAFERFRFTIPTKKDGFKIAYTHDF